MCALLTVVLVQGIVLDEVVAKWLCGIESLRKDCLFVLLHDHQLDVLTSSSSAGGLS